MKKTFVLGLAILLFTGLAMTACLLDRAPYGLPDFSVTVTLDKTEARVGDTITATVVFRNLRGGDIEAELPGWIAERGGQNTEDILDVVFTSNSAFPWVGVSFEPRPKILIEREAVIERQFKHTITVSENLYVRAGAFFVTAETDPDGPAIQALTGPINIIVR